MQFVRFSENKKDGGCFTFLWRDCITINKLFNQSLRRLINCFPNSFSTIYGFKIDLSFKDRAGWTPNPRFDCLLKQLNVWLFVETSWNGLNWKNGIFQSRDLFNKKGVRLFFLKFLSLANLLASYYPLNQVCPYQLQLTKAFRIMICWGFTLQFRSVWMIFSTLKHRK